MVAMVLKKKKKKKQGHNQLKQIYFDGDMIRIRGDKNSIRKTRTGSWETET